MYVIYIQNIYIFRYKCNTVKPITYKKEIMTILWLYSRSKGLSNDLRENEHSKGIIDFHLYGIFLI